MSKAYNKLAGDILSAVGGKENVTSLRHCVTRLRFVLQDEKKAKTDVIKGMDGVVTVVQSAGEYMVVIGEHVHDVFEEVCAHMGIDGRDINKVEITQQKKSVLNRVMDIVMGAMGPAINLMCACGVIKGLLVLLTMAGMSTTDGVYLLLNAAGDCFFYFMPLLLGHNVARKLGIDPAFGFILAAALCYPAIQGVDISLFGYTANATYTGTFLPVVFGVAIAAPIYKFFDKFTPSMVKGFVVPLLTLVITFPLTFLLIGPLANLIGVGINLVLTNIVSISPPIAGLLLGGLWQTMVLFGVHGVLAAFAVLDLLSGNPSLILALAGGASWAVAGTVLAVLLRAREKNLKGLSLPALVSAIFGVTEPSVYGILLPNIRLFVTTSIGAAAGGLITGLFSLKMYTYAGMGIVGLLGYINPDGSTNLLALGAAVVVPFVLAFILALLLFREKEQEVAVAATAPAAPTVVKIDENKNGPIRKRITLVSPIEGTVKPLAECSDGAFSEEALGKGCVIVPTNGKVYAPCDCTVRRIFPTHHAVGLETEDGVEILIHIGIDTIRLDGKYFSVHVNQGDKVKRGQLLLTFDQTEIEKAGYKTESPVVITNTDDYLDVVRLTTGSTPVGTDLLAVLM